MVGLVTSGVVDALDNPIPSGAKRLANWRNAGSAVTPGLDARMLRAKYGPDNAGKPRMIEGTFKIPLGTSWNAYLSHRNDCVNRFVNAMDKQGFDVDRSQQIKVYPGIYPAIDVTTSLPDVGSREFVIRGWFRKHNPKTIRLELPGYLFDPIQPGNKPA